MVREHTSTKQQQNAISENPSFYIQVTQLLWLQWLKASNEFLAT